MSRRRPLPMLLLAAAALAAGCQVPERVRRRADARLDPGDAEAKVAPLTQARTCIAAEDWGRALEALAAIAPEALRAMPPADRQDVHRLRGYAELAQQRHGPAADAFEAALAAGCTDDRVWFALACCRFTLERWRAALAALPRCEPRWRDRADVWGLRVQCHWALHETAEAYGVLLEAERRFPTHADFPRQRIGYLLAMGYPREAAAVGPRFLAAAGETADAHLALGEALRRHGEALAACEVFEAGRLRHPGDARLTLALARAWTDAGRPRLGGAALEAAAARDPALLVTAGELAKRAGDLHRARWLNLGVPDQVAKTRQRVALALAGERWDEAAALAARCSRLGLLGEPPICHALAYAAFRCGDLAGADAHLSRIDLAAPATRAIEASVLALRQAIFDARQEGGGD